MAEPTKDRIINASIELFSKNGYAETSIRDIAKNTGIKTGSIYYHFESKEAILDHILNMYIDIVYEGVQSPASVITEESDITVEKIMSFLFLKFDEEHADRNRKILKIICSESIRNEVIRNYQHKHINTGFQYIKLMLDSLLEAEKIPPCNTTKLAGVLYSITFAFMHLDTINVQNYEGHEDTDMFSLLEYVLKIIMGGHYES